MTCWRDAHRRCASLEYCVAVQCLRLARGLSTILNVLRRQQPPPLPSSGGRLPDASQTPSGAMFLLPYARAAKPPTRDVCRTSRGIADAGNDRFCRVALPLRHCGIWRRRTTCAFAWRRWLLQTYCLCFMATTPSQHTNGVYLSQHL